MIKVIILVASMFVSGAPTYLGAQALDADGVPFTEKSCQMVAEAIAAQLEATKPAEGLYSVRCQYIEVNPKAGSI